MVPSDKHDPVVLFSQASGNLVVYRLVIARLVESEAAISGDDEQGVRTLPSNAELINESLEIPVYVTGYYDLFGLRVFESLAHCSALLIWFSIISFT